MSDTDTFLVTGASGQLGRLVVEALLQRGAKRVIATTRDPAALRDFLDRGVEVRPADFTQPEGLVDAFRGATHLLIISTHMVGSRSDAHRAAIDAAAKAGVRHIFYTSHALPDVSTSPVAPEHALTEKAILESGLTYTILRNFLYSENLLLILPQAVEQGRFHGAAGDAKVAWLTRRDCAEAAAAAMLDANAHENRIYDVTGSKAYSYEGVAAILSKVLRREIVYQDLAPDAYKAALVEQGMSEAAATTYLGLELSLRSGEMEPVSDVVTRLTGHEPTSLEDFFAHGRPTAEPSESLAFLKGELHG